MLNLPHYEYYTNASQSDYEFTSHGPKGVIKKIGRFDKLKQNLYNFGFGDLDEETGEISDTITTNNGDGEKVLATVSNIIHHFTGVFEGTAVFIKGSNEIRTRWYQMNLNKYRKQIEPIFEILGFRNNQWELFRKDTQYEAFIGRRKSTILS